MTGREVVMAGIMVALSLWLIADSVWLIHLGARVCP